MSKTRNGAIALSALIMLGAVELHAQDTIPEPERSLGRMANPELIMSMRDRLELTEEQVAALDAIRAEAVQLRSSSRATIAEAMSRFRAGEIDRAELRTAMEDLREGGPEAAADRRARIEGVLTEAQLETLDELRDRRRAMRRRAAWRRERPGVRRGGPWVRGGRRGAWRGRPGMRPGRPFEPGGRRRGR